jgi:hypothetical protein
VGSRVLLWGIAIVLVLAAGAGAWYYFGPMRYARWQSAHDAAMESIRAAAEGRPDNSEFTGATSLPPELHAKYEAGLALAVNHARAIDDWKKQSAETAKVINVAATALADANQIGLDALRGRIKEVLQGQQEIDGKLDDSRTAIRQWQDELQGAWQSKWPDGHPDVSVFTRAHAVDFNAAGTGAADRLLRDLEGKDQQLIQSLGPNVEEASLSPYQRDKLAAAMARYELAHRMRMALEDATAALSMDSAGSQRTPGAGSGGKGTAQ